jgi:branched-chain amino acid transport system ATP-binding protein
MTSTAMLSVSDLCTGYGAMKVVHDLSLEVQAGEVVSILGRNGAGKTTSMLAMAGLRYSKATGTVMLEGVDVSRFAPAEVVSQGLALVPEGHRIFQALTVLENLELGMSPIPRGKRRSLAKESIERVFDLFAILKEFRARPAGALSGGQQQMVAIGQALMAAPKVLLLDEPTSGLAPSLSTDIYRAVARLKAEGLAVLVVEQNVQRALSNSNRFCVMDRGRIAAEGNSDDPHAFTSIEQIILGTEGVA